MKRIKSNVEVLSQLEIEKIHSATLNILEIVGLKVPDEKCLSICEKHGALVDRDTSVVRIPCAVMEIVLEKVRAKGPGKDVENKNGKITGGISTQVSFVDYKTKTRRYGTLDDVMKGIALVEHLQNITEARPVVVPHDIPQNITDVITYKLSHIYSTKPGNTYVLSTESAKYIIEMAKVMSKTESYLLETVSPLQFRKESLEIALVYAKMGQRLHMAPMVMGGATGPVTLAGTITLENAECLASLFIIFALTNEFCRYVPAAHSIDLRTTICSFGSPNQALLGMASAQLGKFYNLNSQSNSGLTDALIPDFQAGFEKGVTTVFSCLAGNGHIGGQGIVGADQGFSMEQLVIDNEWLDYYNYIHNGIEVNEDAIAAELIERVGIGGNFLAEEHTAAHMRENYWKSGLFNRDNWQNWMIEGSRDILDKAHEFVNSVFVKDLPLEPRIDKSKADQLEYIAGCAEKELKYIINV